MGGRATPQLLYFCSYVTNNIFLTIFGVLVGPWTPTQKPEDSINFQCLGETIPDVAYQICGCFFLPKTCFLERFVTNLFNIKKIDQKVQKKICLLVFFIKPPKKTTPVRVAGWLRVKEAFFDFVFFSQNCH